MARLINSFEQFFDAAGDPLVSGKLYFYESGSSSALKDTYADSAETIANSNPVIIGGDGRCPNVFGTGSYRVILTSADDVTLVTRDPVGGDSDIAFGADWNSPQIYSIDDVVYENGDYWISQTNNNQANQPSLDDGTNWIGISLVNPGSVVSTQGDLIVGNATGVEARLARGNEGQVPTVNNSGDIAYRSAPAQNHIVNGDFSIAQRGTSFTAATTPTNNDDTYLLDRWLLLSDGADVVDVSQETTTVPTGSATAMKALVATANLKFGFLQPLENADSIKFEGNTAVMSFQARNATGDTLGTLRCALIEWTGTPDSITSDVVSAWNGAGTDPTLVANWAYVSTPADLTLTDAFQQFRASGTFSAGIANVALFIWSDDVTTTIGDQLFIGQVKLEFGSVVTEFTTAGRNIAEELAMCQRYFCKTFAQGTTPADGGDNYSGALTWNDMNGDIAQTNWSLPRTMRAIPTLTAYNPRSGGTSGYITNSASDFPIGSLVANTRGDSMVGIGRSVAGSSNQRLYVHLTADAEL